MKQIFFLTICFMLIALLYINQAFANPIWLDNDPQFNDWHIFGSNSIHLEDYQDGGNPITKIYTSKGFKSYDELNLNFDREKSPQERWKGEILGLINESDYRTSSYGIVFEHLNLNIEKEDAFVPLRLNMGDYYGYFSYRTLQRSLKGAEIEFQPNWGGVNQHHSIIFLTGNTAQNYTKFTFSNDQYTGFSWLIDDDNLGSISINEVHNQREAKEAAPSLEQDVTTIASEKDFNFFNQSLTFEDELAYFQGDTPSNNAKDQNDPGFYAQLSGKSASPLTYRFRFEQYGKNFQPNGGNISAARQSMEGHFDWKFPSGLRLQTRYQHFVDGWQQPNATQTNTLGFKLIGSIPGIPEDVSSAIDAYIQNKVNELKTTHTQLRSINVNIPFPTGAWPIITGTLFQDLQDKISKNMTTTLQETISTSHALSVGIFTGFINPGFVYRFLNGNATDAQEFGPTLGLGLNHGPHGIRFNYSLLQQSPTFIGTTHLLSQNLALAYTYEKGPHLITIEVDFTDHRPDDIQNSFGNRFMLTYTYIFDKLPLVNLMTPKLSAALMKKIANEPVSFENLFPGSSLDQQIARLEKQGNKGSRLQKNIIVYEVQMLPTIDERQRLVLVHNGRVIQKTILIIDFNNVGDIDTVKQTLERVRRELLKLYGRPIDTFDVGDFTDNFKIDIYTEKLIRLMEFKTRGGFIRFGIPRRLDRTIRMEILYTPQPMPIKKTTWSIEEVQ